MTTVAPKLLENLEKIRDLVLLNYPKLNLFMLIKRNDLNLYDLVIGGERLDNQDNLRAISNIVQKNLNTNEIVMLSRLALLNSQDAFVRSINSAFVIKQNFMTLKDTTVNNLKLEEAYIFYSTKTD